MKPPKILSYCILYNKAENISILFLLRIALIVVVLIILALTFSACGETIATDSSGLAYRVNADGKTCEINGIGTYEDEDVNVIIPSEIKGYKVTGIVGDAFHGCSSLVSIVVLNSVTFLGDAVFRNCSSLTSITFAGTKAQWNAITKGEAWYSNVLHIIHCTDGDLNI